MKLFHELKKAQRRSLDLLETSLLLTGRAQAERVRALGAIDDLARAEFRVFSQFGDDGIVQWLVGSLPVRARTFIEFGVEDYQESTTRFLLMNDHFQGLVLDGSADNVGRIQAAPWFWKYDLTAATAFVTRNNIGGIVAEWLGGRELGLLHIDVDGNDYWIWEALDIRPAVVIMEYNAVFGPDRTISIPYDDGFVRNRAHLSGLYFGASLGAMLHLAQAKGYAFIGCNSAGNNAYFVRRDCLNDRVREVSREHGWVSSNFRESRDRDGRPTFLSGDARLNEIRGLPVVNVSTGATEPL